MAVFICKTCGSIFERPPSRYGGGYCSFYCSSQSQENIRARSIKMSGPRNKKWQGGKTTTKEGYILVRKRDHLFANCNGRVLEHRLIMEQKLGRYLLDEEVIHHINGIPSDNRPENLLLCSPSDHMRIHHKNRHLPTAEMAEPRMNRE